MRRHALLFVLCLLPSFVFAQFKVDSKPRTLKENLTFGAPKPTYIANLLGLDASRFSMQQSYQMSYLGGESNSYTQGLYLNTMSYQFEIPLTVSMQLGYAHQPFPISGTSSLLNDGLFLSGASLEYKPSENTAIRIEYAQRPFQNNPWMYSRYRDPFNGWDNGF